MWHEWGKSEVRTGFWLGDLRDRDYLEDPGVDGRIILKWCFKKRGGAEDRNRWRAVVNAVMNLRVP
jgi:hypothetical protein